MLVVKTISQFTHTYHVPDALSGDFLRWLNANADTCGDYEVDQQFIHEFIVHAERVDNPRPRDSAGQSDTPPPSGASNEGTGTK
jgi:hypothetical protein